MPPAIGRALFEPGGGHRSFDHAERRARVIGRLIVGFFALIVLAAGIGGVMFQTILSKIDFGKKLSSVLGESDRPAKAGPSTGTGAASKNILILGIDSRLGENSQFQDPNQKKTETLSDTAILAHLSGDGKHVTLVSIPRDSIVQIPSCRRVDNHGNDMVDSSGHATFTTAKKALFNEAIQLGGPYCSVKTLESLTGVRIDNYLEIDFTGVLKMSTALGGVPLTMCNPIHDVNTGLNLPAGPVNLQGQQALAFVRARYGLTGGDDLHRIHRQQQFMASMVRKALSTANFFEPTTMFTFYSAVAGSLSTDMDRSQLLKLAVNYRHTDTSSIVFVTVPTYPAPKGDPFNQHVYWSEDEAKALFGDIHDDRPIPVTTTNGTSVGTISVPPSQVSVKVLNGTVIDGLAHQVGDQLAAAGFHVLSVGTSTDVPTAKTTITYQANRATSMQTLSHALKITPAQVDDASAGTTIVLTIGQDWAGLAAGSASPSANQPTPSSSASAALKATNATTASCVQG